MPNYATRRERELYMLGYMDGEERLEPMKFSINPETRALRKRRGRSVDDTKLVIRLIVISYIIEKGLASGVVP